MNFILDVFWGVSQAVGVIVTVIALIFLAFFILWLIIDFFKCDCDEKNNRINIQTQAIHNSYNSTYEARLDDLHERLSRFQEISRKMHGEDYSDLNHKFNALLKYHGLQFDRVKFVVSKIKRGK